MFISQPSNQNPIFGKTDRRSTAGRNIGSGEIWRKIDFFQTSSKFRETICGSKEVSRGYFQTTKNVWRYLHSSFKNSQKTSFLFRLPVGAPKDWILVLKPRIEQNVWFFVLILKIKHFWEILLTGFSISYLIFEKNRFWIFVKNLVTDRRTGKKIDIFSNFLKYFFIKLILCLRNNVYT